MLKTARIPLSKALRSVRGLVILLLFTSLINMFFTPGEQVLWEAGLLRLTVEGLERSGLMLLRLVALVSFSGLLTFTTTPIELSDALEGLLSPLRRFGVPVHEFCNDDDDCLAFYSGAVGGSGQNCESPAQPGRRLPQRQFEAAAE